MTVAEFKKRYPNLAHLEGEDLWDAMTQTMLFENRHTIKPESQEGEMVTLRGEGISLRMLKKDYDEFVEFCKTDKPLFSDKTRAAFFIPRGNGGWETQYVTPKFMPHMEITTMRDFDKLLKQYDCFGTGCECGVAEGRTSLMFMQMGIPKLYLIDIWKHTPTIPGDAGSPQEWHDNNLKEVKERLASYMDKVIFLQGYSAEMIRHIPDGELSWVYIDAAHDYDSVISDLDSFYHKVKPGGIIAGHDFLNPSYGVNRAVHDFFKYTTFEIHTIPEHEEASASFWVQKI